MPIDLIDKIKQKNAGDFPMVDDFDVNGGFHTAADLTARDAIPNSRRVEGMAVSVVSDGKIYRLIGGITNGDWQEFAGGGGSVDDGAYPTGWDGDTTTAASRNAIFDKVDAMDTAIAANTSKVSADGSVTTHSDVTDAGSGAIITSAERTNLGNQSGTNTGDEPDASTTVKGVVELATDGESSAGVVVQGNDSRLSDARTPTSHASTHITGAVDEIDGDKLDIDFTPTNYTPSTAPPEANSVDNLSAHLSGIDTALGTAGAVDSVNGQTGVVVLDADDIDDASTAHKFVTSSDLTTLSNTSGTNTGDEPDATTTAKGIVELATDGENAANVAVQGNDSRLSDARTPIGSAGGDLGGTYPNPTVNDGADGSAIHDDTAGEIAAVTEKASPVSADLILIEDSAAANAKKRAQIGNLPFAAFTAGDAPLNVDVLSSDPSTPADGDAWFINDGGTRKLRLRDASVTHDIGGGGGGGGHTIQDDGGDLTQRTNLNFIDPIEAADNAGNDATDVTINDATTTAKGVVELATDGENAANVVVQGNDSRLSDNRTDADAIHDNVGGEIAAVTEKASPVTADLLLIEDSAAANAKKRAQIGNLPFAAFTAGDAPLNVDVLSSDPSTPSDGDVWLKDTGGVRTLNARISGVTYSVTLT